MTFEQRLEKVEEAVRHEREMRRLNDARLDAHDTSFDAIRQILDEAARIVKDTAAQQQRTDAMVNELVQALLRGRQNGGAHD